MTWQPGRDTIAELLAGGDLEKVAADERLARRMLDDAGRHLETARTATKSDDVAGAYQLAYDALRKSAASLLAVQGLRATSRGGHVAVQQAVNAQFVSTVRVFRAFGRIRRARNSFEYPEADTGGPTADDVDDALTVASESHAAAMTILDKQLLTPWTAP